MSNDLVNGWDELKDTLPYDHAVAADLLFDYGDKLADHITDLIAERDALAEKLEKVAGALREYLSPTAEPEDDGIPLLRATLAQTTGETNER